MEPSSAVRWAERQVLPWPPAVVRKPHLRLRHAPSHKHATMVASANTSMNMNTSIIMVMTTVIGTKGDENETDYACSLVAAFGRVC